MPNVGAKQNRGKAQWKGGTTSKEMKFLPQFATIQILQNIINSLSIFPRPRNLKDTIEWDWDLLIWIQICVHNNH